MIRRKEPSSLRTGKQYDCDAHDIRAGWATNTGEIFLNEEEIIGFDALYESMMKCKRGVVWKDSVASFYLRGVERTMRLAEQLKDGSYRPAAPKHFTVRYPKEREIVSIAFRDRVYQRSLNDNVVYPLMSRTFIYDNFACQKGKGTDAARNRLKEFLRRHYRKHGATGWVAQFDIHSYYQTMPHTLAEATYEKELPDWAFDRVKTILSEQYDGDAGYNPGSQLVQIAGISVLNGMDHYAKERLHAKLYLRYMDDFLAVFQTKEEATTFLLRLTEYIIKLGFTMNEKKTHVYSLSNGIPFLGFHFTLTDTGKVLMQIDPKRVKAQRKKLFRLVKLAKNGKRQKESVDLAYAAWRNHASKGNNWKLLQRMDKYYRDLWRDTDGTNNQKPAVAS